jgi:flagellar biosynthesis GTPase FlhF
MSDFGVARDLRRDTTLTAGKGATMFMAPEARTHKHGTPCDVWSFGILIGELCKIPGSSLAHDKDLGLIKESNDVEAYLKKTIGQVSSLDFKRNKAVALAQLKERFDKYDESPSLQGLATRCLQMKPQTRPLFKDISPQLESSAHLDFCPEFLSLQKKLDSNRIEVKVATKLRERYQNFKLTSFEWSQSATSDPSSKMMAQANIEMAFVEVLIEHEKIEENQKTGTLQLSSSLSKRPLTEPKNMKYLEKVDLESIWDFKKQDKVKSVEKCKRFVMQGKAGAGKTTLLK